MNKTRLLFIIILIEGYVVLACELLAIRLMIPFVGSGTETISIIISAVLLPLAVGYHYGGTAFARHYRRARARGRSALSVRMLLLRNLLSALAVLTLGMSYLFLELFFAVLSAQGITHRLAQAAIYASLFLVYPVLLLGQTVPLVSHYFSRRKLSEITGRMLFFSTLGSFLGSVFSTIVLMMTIGVHHTAILTLGLLAALVLLLARRRFGYETLLALSLMALMIVMNGAPTMRAAEIVSNNAYNTVSIIDIPQEKARGLVVNRSPASKLADDPAHQFAYVHYIEQIFLSPLAHATPPKRILVIGAGGFTMGLADTHNDYTYVDIDKALKPVAEELFLKQKLSPNKRFEALSARAFVHNSRETYDLIIIDAYTNVVSIPMECITREFLLDVKARLKPGGMVVANVVSSPSFSDRFTVRYHNTFASVFPRFARQAIGDYDPWHPSAQPANVLYIAYNSPLTHDDTVYSDDRNTYSLDR